MDGITVNPRQMGGVPCIRGLRISVATVVGMIADGMTPDEIITELPPSELDDVSAALRFAADAARSAWRRVDRDALAAWPGGWSELDRVAEPAAAE